MQIKIENRKLKLLWGCSLAILCPVCCYLFGGSAKAGFVLMIMALFAAGIHLESKNCFFKNALWTLVFVAVPFCTFVFGQIMQSVTIFTVTPERILLNIGISVIIQLAALIVTENVRISVIVGSVIPLMLQTANAYVYMFRGNALTPSDFLSLRTALNVAGEYSFAPSVTMVYAWLLALILLTGLFCLPKVPSIQIKRRRIRQTILLVVCIVMVSFGCTCQEVRRWNDAGCTYNGFVLNFILQMKEIIVEKPENYDASILKEYENLYNFTQEGKDASSVSPDIIVIMNESFADMNVYETGLNTNIEVTPFVNDLEENTVHGHVYTSIFGGGTANSEYEFLTGNTMGFLPQGSIVYQQYIEEDAYSLVSLLKTEGYRCIAMHPF